ncbi:MAG: universal stress protein [Pseudomonadota bacterium]
MYQKILVPVEPSHAERHQDALEMALALRADESAEVIAVTVIEPMPGYFAAADMLPDLQLKAAQETLKTVSSLLGDGQSVKTKIVHGNAANEINAFAKAQGADCIVIGSHKPELADYLLGSTAARVVRHAPCSVLVMR